MSAKRPITQRDSSTKDLTDPENTLTKPQNPSATAKNSRKAGGNLNDDHPERLRQAAEDMDEVEDEKVLGENSFGTPTPGPARSPGSEH